jgi:hypothetical protein
MPPDLLKKHGSTMAPSAEIRTANHSTRHSSCLGVPTAELPAVVELSACMVRTQANAPQMRTQIGALL